MSIKIKHFSQDDGYDIKPKTVRTKAYFARYVNVTGRRHNVSRQAFGIRQSFTDGVWVRISEDDARKFKADAKSNRTWEYKEEYIIEMETHHYARFTGLNGKKMAKMPMYDRNPQGDVIYETKRDYMFPKDVWILLHKNDVATMQRKANANAFWEFESIKLPSDVEPAIDIKGQSPGEYKDELMAEVVIEEAED